MGPTTWMIYLFFVIYFTLFYSGTATVRHYVYFIMIKTQYLIRMFGSIFSSQLTNTAGTRTVCYEAGLLADLLVLYYVFCCNQVRAQPSEAGQWNEVPNICQLTKAPKRRSRGGGARTFPQCIGAKCIYLINVSIQNFGVTHLDKFWSNVSLQQTVVLGQCVRTW